MKRVGWFVLTAVVGVLNLGAVRYDCYPYYIPAMGMGRDIVRARELTLEDIRGAYPVGMDDGDYERLLDCNREAGNRMVELAEIEGCDLFPLGGWQVGRFGGSCAISESCDFVGMGREVAVQPSGGQGLWVEESQCLGSPALQVAEVHPNGRGAKAGLPKLPQLADTLENLKVRSREIAQGSAEKAKLGRAISEEAKRGSSRLAREYSHLSRDIGKQEREMQHTQMQLRALREILKDVHK